jgi:hypothetical protein
MQRLISAICAGLILGAGLVLAGCQFNSAKPSDNGRSIGGARRAISASPYCEIVTEEHMICPRRAPDRLASARRGGSRRGPPRHPRDRRYWLVSRETV